MNDKLRELKRYEQMADFDDDGNEIINVMHKKADGDYILFSDVEKLINTPKYKTIKEEMKCPKCNSDMKEFVYRYRCRNLDCRIISNKYFAIAKPEIKE